MDIEMSVWLYYQQHNLKARITRSPLRKRRKPGYCSIVTQYHGSNTTNDYNRPVTLLVSECAGAEL